MRSAKRLPAQRRPAGFAGWEEIADAEKAAEVYADHRPIERHLAVIVDERRFSPARVALAEAGLTTVSSNSIFLCNS
jgi:hypothetical protein